MNNKKPIKFGTDGWRGVIADDFTFDNVKKVSKAIALYLAEQDKGTPEVVIGYDTRFHSREFALCAADVLSKAGCRITLGKEFMSTPAVSVSVVDRKASSGIVISASHNPAEFNGIKFKTAYGASAPKDVTNRFEQLLDSEKSSERSGGSIEEQKLAPEYFKRMRSSVDFGLIKRRNLKIAVDPMHGASSGYMDSILKGTKCKVINIHQTPEPMFGGLHPEPIEEYLGDLKKTVKLNCADAGLATDGDGDRIGVIDGDGRYYPPHYVFPLLLYYLCHYKKMIGKVVQAISLGYLSERIAKDHGLEWQETPIGFKYIADRIINENVLIGGEESGGYGYGSYLPERDGVLNSLMFVEMLAATHKPLSVLRKEIEKKYGTSCFLRTDFQKPANAKWTKDEFVDKLKSRAPKSIAGLKIKQIKDYDGIEFVLEDDSWLLLRPSGTEPVIRVYSESPTLEKTKKIISWGEKAVKYQI